MIRLTLQEIASALDAKLLGENLSIEQVFTDTREKVANSLFVALVGERFDAHDYAEQACQQGAKALVVERSLPIAVPQLVVADTRIALGKLGQLVRRKLALPCCAITGSNGKTTVKEMTRSILAQSYEVLATQGNFNNDIGVPLSLLRLQEQHQVGVLELGANHIGEIAYTVSLVEPQVALINNVSPAHIEGFGSRDGVLKAKSEIYQQLQRPQVALVDRESPDYAYLCQASAKAERKEFALNDSGADFYAANISDQGLRGASFELVTPAGMVDIRLSLVGLHNVKNAVAAAALAMNLGASLSDVQQGLAKVEAVAGRLQLVPLSEQLTVVNDSYNANPASFNAALELLKQTEGTTILVAGDMGEMGSETQQVHQDLIRAALDSKIGLYCYGASFKEALQSLARPELAFTDHQDLSEALINQLSASSQACTVLVKGSRSSAMEKVVKALQQHFEKGVAC